MTTCRFVIAYVGRCSGEADASEFCAKHRATKCCACGEQATQECSYTGQFVCGAALCDGCTGYEDRAKPSGAWGFLNHGHRRKEAAAAPASGSAPR